jgi:hypothetical protein
MTCMLIELSLYLHRVLGDERLRQLYTEAPAGMAQG